MPNKLRLKNREDIVEGMVDQMSPKTMGQEIYSNLFDYIDNIGDEELKEIYADQPELLYRPTLSEQLDEIFNKLSENLKKLSHNAAWRFNLSDIVWWDDMRDFHEGTKYQLDQIREEIPNANG